MTADTTDLHLTRQESAILAMVLAECGGQGFDERDFWLTEEAYRDYRWLRDVASMYTHDVRAEAPDTPAPSGATP